MDDTKPSAAKSMEVESFLLRFPEQMRPAYRRLLYYAAMPLVLTPELLHYLRNAFVRESPWVAEADLLLADNLFEEKNFEQYVMATPVRTLLLREAAEQLGERNMQEAARLLVSYLYRHLPFSSISPSEVTAQRWAALLYLDDYHDKVVAEIVQALHEALSASDAVSGYEGRAAFESMLDVINQIAPTLADNLEVVDFARLIQSLLHEEIDPGSISQERLMQSPVVAGVQLPSLAGIVDRLKVAVLEGTPTDEDTVQFSEVERHYPDFKVFERYGNFDLLVLPASENSYEARVVSSPVGQAGTFFTLPFSQDELRFVSVPSASPLTPRQIGERLFAAVFTGAVGECYVRSLDAAARDNQGLRICLYLKDAPALAQLPWEYLYAPLPTPGFVALSDRTTIVRLPEIGVQQNPLNVIAPLHLLVVVSNPQDTHQLDLERQYERLEQALGGLIQRNLLRLERLAIPTMVALRNRLRDRQAGDVHMLHFIGHADWDEQWQTSVLYFEGNARHANPVSMENMAILLKDHNPLRLVFLDAFQGARTGHGNIVLGVAQTLVEQGIPAVVAMQFPVREAVAIELEQAFYQALALGFPVDVCVSAGRQALTVAGSELEWGALALFSRSADSRVTILNTDQLPANDASEPDQSAAKLVVLPIVSLDESQHAQLAEALTEAFDQQSLAEMVLITLDVNLATIAGDDTLITVAFNLVDWTNRSGYLTELVQGAVDAQPRNQKLRDFAKSVGARETGLSGKRREQVEEESAAAGSSRLPQLSDRQRKILEFLIEFRRTHGISPTLRQIGEGAAITSTAVVNYNLIKLERLGLITWERDQSRGTRLNYERLREFGFETDDIQRSESPLGQIGSSDSPDAEESQQSGQTLPTGFKRLTERQMAILQSIVDFVDTHDYPPTVREIGNSIGVSSTSVVNYNLNKLESLGLLGREREVTRGISLNRDRLKEFGLDIRPSSKAATKEAKLPHAVRVPVLGSIGTAVPLSFDEAADPGGEWIEVPVAITSNRGQLFALRVIGDSLTDASIAEGDVVVLRRQSDAPNGALVLANLIENDDYVVRQFYHRRETIELRAANPAYTPMFVPADKVVISGVVVAVIRRTA